MADSLTSSRAINGIYIPAGLIVLGTFILKRDFVPYAIALAAVLGGWKFYGFSMGFTSVFL